MELRNIAILGYSGHAYVIIDILNRMGRNVSGYLEDIPTIHNPYQLEYMDHETRELGQKHLKENDYFIAIGSNRIREKITNFLINLGYNTPINAIHPSAIISTSSTLGSGVMVASNAVINPMSTIGDGVICNTGSIIEHECKIGNFAHIASGAVLAGNVSIGEQTFVGANSVIKQGIKIGNKVTIGAGTVILKDIPDGRTVVGNPQRFIK